MTSVQKYQQILESFKTKVLTQYFNVNENKNKMLLMLTFSD